MHTAIYAVSRLILFGFGWTVAAACALLAEMMLSGMLWPLFAVIAGWWTFACAVYIDGENGVAAHTDQPVPDAVTMPAANGRAP